MQWNLLVTLFLIIISPVRAIILVFFRWLSTLRSVSICEKAMYAMPLVLLSLLFQVRVCSAIDVPFWTKLRISILLPIFCRSSFVVFSLVFLRWCKRAVAKKQRRTHGRHQIEWWIYENAEKANEWERERDTVKLETKFHDAMHMFYIKLMVWCGVVEAKTNILRAHAYTKREQTMDKRTYITNNNNYECKNLPLNIPVAADKTYHPWKTENKRKKKYGN